uniref:RING-CH-type domain-containing protein n=1 Tax=Tanacetum cinerariifolium TaxID=118510 RepID=A0A6L2JGA6_TANCI|nr:hypothetical protein [Tanacetum cinerariifolium]
MAAILAHGGSPFGMRREAQLSRTVPVTPIAHSSPESMDGRNAMHVVPRSHSAPELLEAGYAHGTLPTLDFTPAVFEAEEEADVCRICMDELQEGAQDTLKLECHCRGELALAHKECAVKWFSDRGNMICEICNHEVMNLHVMHSPTFRFIMVWQHEPDLLILSMLAYMVFLVLFLIDEMDDGKAITISVSSGCILGLLGSKTSTIMVRGRYAWIYATVQFILVVCVAYAFRYSQVTSSNWDYICFSCYHCWVWWSNVLYLHILEMDGVKPASRDPEVEEIDEMDDGEAVTISVSSGCILGLLGSMTSTIMVRRRYAWIYATVQFILVVCVAYTFRYLQVNEEADVYRICMGELQEGAQDTLKLECHYRGELALTHKECTVKWFSDKGNMICEICNHEVCLGMAARTWSSHSEHACLLGLLGAIFDEMDDGEAVVISVPSGCILGLLGSMTSTIMVRRRYAWIYATVQFILVLHLTGIIYSLLTTFVGFGGPMCFTYIFLKWMGSNQHCETQRWSR